MVIDANCLYSSENEYEDDSDCTSDSNLNKDLDQQQQNVQQMPKGSTDIQSTVEPAPIDELSQLFLTQKPDGSPLDSKDKAELINDLIAFVISNTTQQNIDLNHEEATSKSADVQPTLAPINDSSQSEGVPTFQSQSVLNQKPDESLVLKSEEKVEPVELINDLFDVDTLNTEEDVLLGDIKSIDNFDLDTYITGQSVSQILPEPSLQLTPIKTMQDNKITQNTRLTTSSSRSRNVKREFLGDSSESDDDTKSKKPKMEDDPLWMPSERSKIKLSKKSELNTTIYNKSNKGNQAKVLKCSVNNIRRGVGCGKNIATLTKLYKTTTSSDNSSCDKNKKTHSKSISANERIRQLKKKNHCSAQKSQKNVNKKSKDYVSEKKKTIDLSDFGKVIVASMAIAPRKKPNPLKNRNHSERQNRVKQSKERLQSPVILKVEFNEKRSLEQTGGHLMPVVASDLLKTRSGDNIENPKLPEQQQKVETKDCGTIEKEEQPTKTRKIISFQEYRARQSINTSTSAEIN